MFSFFSNGEMPYNAQHNTKKKVHDGFVTKHCFPNKVDALYTKGSCIFYMRIAYVCNILCSRRYIRIYIYIYVFIAPSPPPPFCKRFDPLACAHPPLTHPLQHRPSLYAPRLPSYNHYSHPSATLPSVSHSLYIYIYTYTHPIPPLLQCQAVRVA